MAARGNKKQIIGEISEKGKITQGHNYVRSSNAGTSEIKNIGSNVGTDIKTLADYGLTKKDSFRAQQLAEVLRILKDPEALNLLDTVTKGKQTISYWFANVAPITNGNVAPVINKRNITLSELRNNPITLYQGKYENIGKKIAKDRLKLLKRPAPLESEVYEGD